MLIGLAILLGIIFGLLSLPKGPLFGLIVVSLFIAIPLGIVLLILTAMMLALGVHELGHYIAGRLVGLQFYMLRIGPFSWRKLANKVKFTVEKSGQLSGGFASMGPTDNRNLLARHRWNVLGGPLASLILLGIIALCLPWREALWGGHKNEGLVAFGGRLIVMVSPSTLQCTQPCRSFRIGIEGFTTMPPSYSSLFLVGSRLSTEY